MTETINFENNRLQIYKVNRISGAWGQADCQHVERGRVEQGPDCNTRVGLIGRGELGGVGVGKRRAGGLRR